MIKVVIHKVEGDKAKSFSKFLAYEEQYKELDL